MRTSSSSRWLLPSGSGVPRTRVGISYVDSLFLVISAMTQAGLNTVNLSQMTTLQQVMLWLLIIIGSSVWVSIWTILRLRSLEMSQTRPTTSDSASVRELGAFAPNSTGSNLRISRPVDGRPVAAKVASTPQDPSNGNGKKASTTSRSGTNDSASLAMTDHIVFAEDSHEKATSTSMASKDAAIQRQVQGTNHHEHKSQPHSYLPRDKVGRNAQFHSFMSEEHERLGGTEYRALKLLSVLVLLYSFLWQFLGCIALGVWIANSQPGPAERHFQRRISFQQQWHIFEAGHLRGPASRMEEDARAHPQIPSPRLHESLSGPANMVAFMLFVLNGTDWIAFEVLNLGSAFLGQTSLGTSVIDGLFQALAVRSRGFYVVLIPTMFIGMQVLYAIMMYVSVYAVVVAMRHSNVYKERSLGIYVDDGYEPELPLHRRISNRSTASRRQEVGNTLRHTLTAWLRVGAVPSSGKDPTESRVNFLSHQIRSQLSHDLWWLVLVVLLICIIETKLWTT
ncbi:hypothetical protein DL767_004394 [Monosporascus sp. MG133]|nr:hypothetical protein DL767_004394 [Monosporascus sp. MG133]